MTRRSAHLGAMVVLVSVLLGACRDGRSRPTLRGSTPCPPGDGIVETWCDDAGNCEYRVVGGSTFSCHGGDSAGCMQAAQNAFDACRSGADGADAGPGPADAGTVGSPDAGAEADGGTGIPPICTELCAACGGERCAGCSEYVEAARSAGCEAELQELADCLLDLDCELDVTSCAAESLAVSECVCPSLLPVVRQRAQACGRSFDYTCDDEFGGALAFACTPALERHGCAAFDMVDCGNF